LGCETDAMDSCRVGEVSWVCPSWGVGSKIVEVEDCVPWLDYPLEQEGEEDFGA